MDYALAVIIIIIMILIFAGGTVGAGYLTNYIFNDNDKTIDENLGGAKSKLIKIIEDYKIHQGRWFILFNKSININLKFIKGSLDDFASQKYLLFTDIQWW